ncbi:FKBP-type peptidyl-prolyl cis-trans isomerase [Pseudoduganella plicata]|uniref:Peptidyl-prolyl cis-trans isomerase n=1 Tax=Pseudoduganella plicata TaxID=321984 RepID=A0A4P7BGP1_9BURK|nr:FKBP-type peptidyl-prolyl cis-trans isomerase [Pseudoduganella plicata]QBQ37413.1 FKBP-type peptidyl-prolyl cis-trans isomerase [Pseudoduganella plicata]GGZ08480.1 peptidyl-prolyl cis-trans isomerase [Pseudoduganella plicata]
MKSIFQFVASIACAVALTACGGGGSDTPAATAPVQPVFSKTDTVVGTGTEAVAGDTVTVHYTGWLYSDSAGDKKGTQFETSVGGAPFSFPLGQGKVIAGWDQGVVGMKVGGKRTLIMPASMAYGSTPQVKIPANSALVFDVEVLAMKR